MKECIYTMSQKRILISRLQNNQQSQNVTKIILHHVEGAHHIRAEKKNS